MKTFYDKLSKKDKKLFNSDDFTLYYFIGSCNSENDFNSEKLQKKSFREYKKQLRKEKLENWFIDSFISGINNILNFLHIKAFFNICFNKVHSFIVYSGDMEKNYKKLFSINFNKKYFVSRGLLYK